MKKNYRKVISFSYIFILLLMYNTITIASAQVAQSTSYRTQRSQEFTIRKSVFGRQDGKGHNTTIRKDIFGNTVIEDNGGNKKTIGKDIFGNTVIEDSNGNKTTIKKDIFGDIVIEKR